jgi:hypothetical protein
MGKTILELFQTKPLTQGPFVGQTAEVAYAVRDFKKETPLSGPSPLLNSTGFALANIARRNLSIKNGESLFEQETTGIRIIRLGAIPVIYGTDLLRITQRTTNVLDAMKSASNGGAVADAGLVGNALNKAKEGASKFASKLGIEFPEKMIPSRIVLNDTFKNGLESKTPETLARIKKDAAGNLVGKFLAKNVSGTPTQIGNAVVGGAIKGAKSAVRKQLFGSRTEAGQNLAKTARKEDAVDYSSKTKYSKTVDATNDDIKGRNDLVNLKSKVAELYEVLPPIGYKKTSRTPTFPLKLKEPYTENKNLGESEPIDRNDLSAELFARRSNYERTGSAATQIPTFPNRNNKNKYFYDSNNQQRYAYTGISNFSDDNIRDVVITGAERGINNGADAINAYDVGQNDERNIIDFITLKFDTTQFRATITGLTETFSPSWDSNKFIGSPFNYYTYSGIERSVSFNFKVFSLNIEEHNKAWNKLQYLAKKTYPIGYAAFGVVAPIIDFTMTDLYSRKKSFIESLSFTIDDNYPWEVFVEGLRLPHIIDVAITLKFIEQRGDEAKLYDFENLTNLPSVKRASKGEDQKIKEKPIAN